MVNQVTSTIRPCEKHDNRFHLAHMVASLESGEMMGVVYARQRPNRQNNWYRFYSSTRRWGPGITPKDMPGHDNTVSLGRHEFHAVVASGLFQINRLVDGDYAVTDVNITDRMIFSGPWMLHGITAIETHVEEALKSAVVQYGAVHCAFLDGYWDSVYDED